MNTLVTGMDENRFVFHRPQLALRIVDDLAGAGIGDYSSGLFLALHRRTGKSTFLREDFIPAVENRGWLPVYVDLWADKTADPAKRISQTIARALQSYEGAARSLLKAMAVEKVSILRTLNWDLSKQVLPSDATLADALMLLHELSGKRIVLIIDEAQHALTSEDGMNAMFALKAARDELNQGKGKLGLNLVFTGSSRDKLGDLLHSRTQPFYGASITPFPPLGRDFAEEYTEFLNSRMAATNQFNSDDVYEAFTLVGNRPETLSKIIKEVAVDLGAASNMKELIRNGALNLQAGVREEYESIFNMLTPIQQSVMQVMAEYVDTGKPFPPFSKATISAVQARMLAKHENAETVTTTGIQNALIALREQALIWKPGRGNYTLEDADMVEWLAGLKDEKKD